MIFLETSSVISSDQPYPLPDRKALDDVVFDALGLTEAERKEVYWAVCELVPPLAGCRMGRTNDEEE